MEDLPQSGCTKDFEKDQIKGGFCYGRKQFQNTVEALFKGMDSFITTKTVVGDAITVGDTIILPLVDVSFGVGAGALQKAIKQRSRRYGRKDFSVSCSGHQ